MSSLTFSIHRTASLPIAYCVYCIHNTQFSVSPENSLIVVEYASAQVQLDEVWLAKNWRLIGHWLAVFCHK